MTLSDLEWLSEIFNDMKRRAVSLRQLSFLLNRIYRTQLTVVQGSLTKRCFNGTCCSSRHALPTPRPHHTNSAVTATRRCLTRDVSESSSISLSVCPWVELCPWRCFCIYRISVSQLKMFRQVQRNCYIHCMYPAVTGAHVNWIAKFRVPRAHCIQDRSETCINLSLGTFNRKPKKLCKRRKTSAAAVVSICCQLQLPRLYLLIPN